MNKFILKGKWEILNKFLTTYNINEFGEILKPRNFEMVLSKLLKSIQ